MYDSRSMHTEGLGGSTWFLAAELRLEGLVSWPNLDLGEAESSGESGHTGLVGWFACGSYRCA